MNNTIEQSFELFDSERRNFSLSEIAENEKRGISKRNPNPIGIRIKNNSSGTKIVPVFSLSYNDPEVKIQSVFDNGHSYERLLKTCLTRPIGIGFIRIIAAESTGDFIRRPMTFKRLGSDVGYSESSSFLPIRHFSRWQYQRGIVDLPYKMRIDGYDELHIMLESGEEVVINFFIAMQVSYLTIEALAQLKEFDWKTNKFKDGIHLKIRNNTSECLPAYLFNLTNKYEKVEAGHAVPSDQLIHQFCEQENGIEISEYNIIDAYSHKHRGIVNEYEKTATYLIDSNYEIEKICLICDNKKQFHHPIEFSSEQKIESPFAYIDDGQQQLMAHIKLDSPFKVDGSPINMIIEPNTCVDLIIYRDAGEWGAIPNRNAIDSFPEFENLLPVYNHKYTTNLFAKNDTNEWLSDLNIVPCCINRQPCKWNTLRLYFDDIHDLKMPFAFQHIKHDGTTYSHTIFPIMSFDVYKNSGLGFVDVIIPEFTSENIGAHKLIFKIGPGKNLNANLLYNEKRADDPKTIAGYMPIWAIGLENTLDDDKEVGLFNMNALKYTNFGIPEGVNLITGTSYSKYASSYSQIMATCHGHEEIPIDLIRIMTSEDFKSGYPVLKFSYPNEQDAVVRPVLSPYQQTTNIVDVHPKYSTGPNKKITVQIPGKTTTWLYVILGTSKQKCLPE